MSLQSMILNSVQNRLPKVIDSRTHGMIDYCHAAFFLTMALVWRKKEPRAALAAAATGTFILAESLLTDYPLGAAKVLPFETHGRLDSAFAASSFVIPSLFGFNDSAASNVFKLNGFVEGTIVGMTDFDSERARVKSEEPLALAS